MLVMGLKLLLVAGLLSCCSKWLCNGVMMTGSQLSHPMNYGVVQFFGVFTNSRGGGGTGARMAVSDITKHNGKVGLPLGVNLKEGESGCGVKEDAVAIFTRLLQNPEMSPSASKPILLAGCHSDCFQLAQAGMEHDAFTMCYGLKSMTLTSNFLDIPSSSMNLFMMEPDLFSTVVTPLLKLILHFGWRKVAVLSFSGDPLVQLAEHVSSVLEEHEIQVGRVGGDADTFSEQSHLGLIQQHNFKVIIAVVGGEAQGRELVCGVQQAGFTATAGYVWIFIGPTGHQWLMNPVPSAGGCPADKLVLGAEGHLILNPVNWHPDLNFHTISNRTASSFRREVTGILGRSGSGDGGQTELDEASLAYDAVWAAYIGVASSMLENGGNFPGDVDDTLNRVMFHGVSGPVSFYEGKRSVVGVMVRVDQFRGGRYSPIAHHFNSNNSWAWIRPSPFGPVTPGDGFGVGEMPLPEFPFWPPVPPRENFPPKDNSASLHSFGPVYGCLTLTYCFLLLIFHHSQISRSE